MGDGTFLKWSTQEEVANQGREVKMEYRGVRASGVVEEAKNDSMWEWIPNGHQTGQEG